MRYCIIIAAVSIKGCMNLASGPLATWHVEQNYVPLAGKFVMLSSIAMGYERDERRKRRVDKSHIFHPSMENHHVCLLIFALPPLLHPPPSPPSPLTHIFSERKGEHQNTRTAVTAVAAAAAAAAMTFLGLGIHMFGVNIVGVRLPLPPQQETLLQLLNSFF